MHLCRFRTALNGLCKCTFSWFYAASDLVSVLCKYAFTYTILLNSIHDFILNTKYILKNAGNQTALGTINFNCMDKKTETFLKIFFFMFHSGKKGIQVLEQQEGK